MSKDGVCMMLARSLQDLSHTPWRGSHVHCHPWIVLQLWFNSWLSGVSFFEKHWSCSSRLGPIVFLLSEVQNHLGLLKSQFKFVYLLYKRFFLCCKVWHALLEVLYFAFELHALLDKEMVVLLTLFLFSCYLFDLLIGVGESLQAVLKLNKKIFVECHHKRLVLGYSWA